MSTTTRDDILAGEQRAVDHAYDCYTTKLAELSGTSAATASASGKDGIANRAQAEARAEAYGGLGDEALVFSRVDAPEEPGGEPRPWYIGRRGVKDSANDPVVLLWTSPLAKKWIETRPEHPGEVVLRRQLRCTADRRELLRRDLPADARSRALARTRARRSTGAPSGRRRQRCGGGGRVPDPGTYVGPHARRCRTTAAA